MFFRPPSPIRLPVPRLGQNEAGECLAACAAMACAYLHIRTDYGRLLRLLKVEPGVGVPFHHIRALDALGLSVIYAHEGTLAERSFAALLAGEG